VLGTTTTANLTITDFVFAVPNAPGSGVLSSSTPTGNLILGNNSNNAIAGGNLNDTIAAFAGDDVVFGFGGNDSIDGGLGNDTLNGGVGNDTLIGSVGNNQLTGGLGADVFVIRTTGSFDTVVDFEDGIDRIRTSPATTFNTLVGASFLNARQSGADTLLSVNGVDIARLLNFMATNFSGADLI
jgi:Ca2+-binding RTX toxin-like protein